MTEMLEPVAVARVGHEDHDEDTCAFCQMATEPKSEENDLTDNFDEDANETPGLNDAGMAHKNKSGTLGTNLENNGQAQIETEVRLDGVDTPLLVQSAAHHIIPGNASLKDSEIMEYLHTDGMAKGNIGYDVNNYENGVWLVGNYAMRKSKGWAQWGSGGSGFQKEYGKDPYEYAKAAIEAGGAQFHDAHPKYSDQVVEVLDRTAEKMDLFNDVWCPEAGDKPDKPEERQLYMLVNRLNTISRRLKRLLENPGTNWKKNWYTSEYSRHYIKEEIYGKNKSE